MSATTTGIEVRARSRWVREGIELLSSMRFSISLLTVICLASVIGTVVNQHEPFGNYVNKFGPFWAQVFATVGLDAVYGVWWFVLILAFLVVSTSLCIARNTPKILHDLRNYKQGIRAHSLDSFHHKGHAPLDESAEAAYERIAKLLVGDGWRAKVEQRRDAGAASGTMIAARRGAANKLGYIAAHSAIVLVCIGGLLDGDLVVRAQMLWQGKSPYLGGGFIRDVPQKHWLSGSNPTFRGELPVVEGARAGVARLSLGDGLLLQPLPFDVELKKFIVDYYATGMPKLFASDIVIHDHETGESIAATVKVNEPVFHRGVAIYQSSFDDGGSNVKLRAIPMTGKGRAFDIEGVIGGSTQLSSGDDKLTLEFTGLRVINVENLGDAGGSGDASGTDVRRVDLGSLTDHLGSGAKVRNKRELRNVGPSISYKLRDASGQAREFNNYMLPIELDGARVFLAGARDKPDEPMRYLRIPVDDQDSLAGWTRLRAALSDASLRDKAASRYVALATPDDKPEMAAQLRLTAVKALALFAGAESVKGQPATGAGLQALSDFIESTVPPTDRARISDVLLRILNGSLFELLNLSRENAGLAALAPDEKTQAFMTQSVLSLSDSFSYPAPLLLELGDFKQVQQSVFQVARAPGKTLVYIGAVLLIVGVFSMLYIRERRLWVWIAPNGDASSEVRLAMSTTRRTLDADAEFESLKRSILKGSS